MQTPPFDAVFFRTSFPELVQAECQRRPEQVPVVLLHLADGTALDVCHILSLADQWLALAYFSDSATCEEMEIAFVRYDQVTRVTLALHHPAGRHLGFDVAKSREASHV